MAFLRKNFARGILTSDVGVGDSQITLDAGHTLPTESGTFRLVIWDHLTYPDPAEDPGVEVVTGSYSGTPNVYDVVRAQEDTVASAHTAKDKVGLHYTAGVSEDDLSAKQWVYFESVGGEEWRMGIVGTNFEIQKNIGDVWTVAFRVRGS